MSQILNQDEINALLEAVRSGVLETVADEKAAARTPLPEDVRPYDLTSQDRPFRGRLPMLDAIHEEFCRGFRGALSAMLRRAAAVEVGDIGEIEFGEFLEGLPRPTCFSLFTMQPLRGTGAVIIETGFAFTLVDLLLGGSGAPRARGGGRDFSAIELNVVRKAVDVVLREFQQAWDAVQPVKIEYQRVEINPRFVPIARATETVLLIESDVDIEGSPGLVQIVLPYAMIEPIKGKLSFHSLGEGIPRDDARWRDSFAGAARDAKVEVVTRLGQGRLTVGELLALEVGQVLPLDKFGDEPADVLVESVPKFKAMIGITRGCKSARIVQPRR
jgi:flagellar motor switch protein FliM